MLASFRFGPKVSELLRHQLPHVVITGAGGWLGRATLELVDAALGAESLARLTAFGSHRRLYQAASGRRHEIHALEEIAEMQCDAALVFHYAYLGKEQVSRLGAETFSTINRAISDSVERFCRRLDRGALFFASSGAAAFAASSPLDADREPYGRDKISDEARFLRVRRGDFRVAVGRVFSMGGPYINKLREYALSSILLETLGGGPVNLRAERHVYRSFTYVVDVIEAVTATLLAPDAAPPEEVFDIASPQIIEIGELAERAVRLLSPGAEIRRPSITLRESDYYVGSPLVFEKLMRRLGRDPVPLDDQIVATAAFLREWLSS